jgi:peroxiredoxin Q/BCP
MSQLRQDYEAFVNLGAEILVIGPENAEKFRGYWEKENMPFTGLPDPNHKVLNLFGQQVKIFRLGRMPAQALVDKDGITRYTHYGNSMSDIPSIEEIIALLEKF